MIPLTLAEVADAVGGTVHDGDPATVVAGPATVDSRQVEPGGLFVALPGRRVDGHDFAAAAVGAGAAAVLAQRPVGVPAVVVDDAVAAVGRLAAAVRERLSAMLVLAITGSNGKTTTKDLLAALLGRLGPVVANTGSQNNDLGVPLTLLQGTAETRYLVTEMGMSSPGEIARRCAVAAPAVGVELGVGTAHIEFLGSQDAIAQAKAELVQALPTAGLAVLNADDPRTRAMAALTVARVVLVGSAADADVRVSDVAMDADGHPSFTLAYAGRSAPVTLRLRGEHNVVNAACAAAVALSLGMTVADAALVLARAEPASPWRMEVHRRADGVTVINDAYNASPESMRAALRTLAGMAGGRPTWAVLGPMGELGPYGPQAHDEIGRLTVRLNVTHTVAVGPDARLISGGAALEGSWSGESVWVADADAAVALLREQVRPGDLVLVKASRYAGLERVARALLDDRATASAATGGAHPAGDGRPGAGAAS